MCVFYGDKYNMINKKLGYYTVGDVEFDSKIKACIYAQTNNQDVVWHFNNEIFEKYSWHIEPEKSLDELYDVLIVALFNANSSIVPICSKICCTSAGNDDLI